MHLVIKDIFDTSCKEQLLYQHNIFHTGRPKEAIISSGSQHHHMAWLLSRPAKIQAHQTQGDWKGARIIIFFKFLLLPPLPPPPFPFFSTSSSSPSFLFCFRSSSFSSSSSPWWNSMRTGVLFNWSFWLFEAGQITPAISTFLKHHCATREPTILSSKCHQEI